MERNYTNYSAEGIVKNKSRARLVQKTIENYIYKSNLGFSVLQKVWFDDLQGGKGVIKKLADIDKKNEQNYYIEDPIILRDGTKIAICNQWGKDNFSTFITHARLLGFEINIESAYTEEHDIKKDVLKEKDMTLTLENQLIV
jgi:hypothetical protein